MNKFNFKVSHILYELETNANYDQVAFAFSMVKNKYTGRELMYNICGYLNEVNGFNVSYKEIDYDFGIDNN